VRLRVRGGDERCVAPQHGGRLFLLTNNSMGALMLVSLVFFLVRRLLNSVSSLAMNFPHRVGRW